MYLNRQRKAADVLRVYCKIAILGAFYLMLAVLNGRFEHLASCLPTYSTLFVFLQILSDTLSTVLWKENYWSKSRIKFNVMSFIFFLFLGDLIKFCKSWPRWPRGNMLQGSRIQIRLRSMDLFRTYRAQFLWESEISGSLNNPNPKEISK